jgi:DNA-binding transcriptional regulator YiaG
MKGAKSLSFKELRQKMGLTQRQVANIYQIPYSTIQKWEHDINTPPDYVLNMMWELYNMKYWVDKLEGNK